LAARSSVSDVAYPCPGKQKRQICSVRKSGVLCYEDRAFPLFGNVPVCNPDCRFGDR